MRWLIFSLALLLNMVVARADFLNSMEQALMPGPLHKSHAKFETDCTNCHVLLKKTFQNDHCLKCHDHENIARDIESGKGLHGRIPDVKTRECKGCHSEHKGRDAAIVLLDAQTFNHTATDYPLRGRHATTRCTACHAADKKYRQAASVCYDCHGTAGLRGLPRDRRQTSGQPRQQVRGVPQRNQVEGFYFRSRSNEIFARRQAQGRSVCGLPSQA
ncbi:MAG: hypothetical protein HY273_00320 [Gammaproteobacteria bacterium]|nr:hypothetical protein [Gammaproteobacteria bacterium]